MVSLEDQILSVVRTIIEGQVKNGQRVTPELVARHSHAVVDMYSNMHPPDAMSGVDLEVIIRKTESDFNVTVANGGILSDGVGHEAWLPQRRSEIEWLFWSRYRQYLSTVGKMPPAAVDRLDEMTDLVLERLEDPTRPGRWDQRGLVAGNVQSGKTGNYIGLVCKGIDSGYKLIVVLAGIHNSLRAQTQVRVDEGILGFNTEHIYFAKPDNRVGVGLLAGQFLHANTFTSRKQKGDFSLNVARQVGVNPGGADPVILVVKKNKSILTNLLQWSTSIAGVRDEVTGKRIVRGVPLLVIDDEADQASVDTNGPKRGAAVDEYEPTVINGLVRSLLDRFEQSAYVGYTATPFANIFIHPDIEHDDAGQGLFPRSFIVSLPAPSTYVGPARVFGLEEDVTRNLEYVRPLPIVRPLDDNEDWLPNKHTKTQIPGAMPDSLVEAMHAFVLTCAVRAWRGQAEQHNSMLVHVTRFVDVQRRVKEQVDDELTRISHHLKLDSGRTGPIWTALKSLYQRDFIPTSADLGNRDGLGDQIGELPTWRQLTSVLPTAVDRIETKLINGEAKDALEYADADRGLSVIAIGGAKLSRGLTLEGLSISYYLRASFMYDTLMQMGRWFGYRPHYLDLCRLYTTPELVSRYRRITEASEELYQEFDLMVALGRSPREFGLRVRQHPDGLMVTSPNRMRAAKSVMLSFAGTVSETILFRTDVKTRERNAAAADELVSSITASTAEAVSGAPGQGHGYLWKGVSSDHVIKFLDSYQGHEAAYKVQPKALREYVLGRLHDTPSELVDWWVLIVNSAKPDATAGHKVGGLDVAWTMRSQFPEDDANSPADPSRYSIRRLVSPPHEGIDCRAGTAEYETALQYTQTLWRESPRRRPGDEMPLAPNGIAYRQVRPPERGVLILYTLNPDSAPKKSPQDEIPYVGFALSFPSSDNAKPAHYQVAVDAWAKLVGAVDETPDEDDEPDDLDGAFA